MITNMSNDITKELNLKSIQSSLNKKVDNNTKLKTFEDTFNKKLNNDLDNKKEEKVDSCDNKVDKSCSKDNEKNDYKKKLEKLKDKLDKLSKTVDDEDGKEGKDVDKAAVNNTIDELMMMLNNLISQLEGKENNFNLQKDESSMNAIGDMKASILLDMQNPKNSGLTSELKEIAKLLEPMKNNEEVLDLNNIKSIIDSVKEIIGKNENGLEKQDFKTNIINELKVALSNTAKEKENINNSNKENNTVDNKTINVNNIKVETEGKASNSNDTFKGSDGSNKNSTSSEDKTIKKEESFLDSLVNDKDKNAINRFMPGTASKINTFEAALAKTSESAQSVNKANIVDGIVKNIKFMQTNDLKELTVSMNPKELGSMIIKISVEDGRLSAKIIAEKKETFNLINSNATDVKNALGTINDRVQEVSVNIQFGDATAYEQFKEGQGYQGNEKRYTNGSDNVVSEEDMIADKIEDDLYGDSVVNMLA